MSESRLRRNEPLDFDWTDLKSIAFPKSVEVIGDECFKKYKCLHEMMFERTGRCLNDSTSNTERMNGYLTFIATKTLGHIYINGSIHNSSKDLQIVLPNLIHQLPNRMLDFGHFEINGRKSDIPAVRPTL
jgi:hypothetical protein